MAKDDYDVIVYKVLAYLYTQLKAGSPAEARMLKPVGPLFSINELYWQFIMESLLKEGYITGIRITKVWGAPLLIEDLESCQITPAGIHYVTDNSFMEKAKQFLKEAKEITPFI